MVNQLILYCQSNILWIYCIPYFHSTVESMAQEMDYLINLSNSNTGDCYSGFILNTNITAVQDIYDECIAYAQQTLATYNL